MIGADTGRGVLEIREYRAAPGKLPDLLHRFATDNPPLFRRHGIRVLAAWADEARGVLTYIVPWGSDALRESTWAAFVSSEAWNAVKARTEMEGPLIESIRTTVYDDLTPRG